MADRQSSITAEMRSQIEKVAVEVGRLVDLLGEVGDMEKEKVRLLTTQLNSIRSSTSFEDVPLETSGTDLVPPETSDAPTSQMSSESSQQPGCPVPPLTVSTTTPTIQDNVDRPLPAQFTAPPVHLIIGSQQHGENATSEPQIASMASGSQAMSGPPVMNVPVISGFRPTNHSMMPQNAFNRAPEDSLQTNQRSFPGLSSIQYNVPPSHLMASTQLTGGPPMMGGFQGMSGPPAMGHTATQHIYYNRPQSEALPVSQHTFPHPPMSQPNTPPHFMASTQPPGYPSMSTPTSMSHPATQQNFTHPPMSQSNTPSQFMTSTQQPGYPPMNTSASMSGPPSMNHPATQQNLTHPPTTQLNTPSQFMPGTQQPGCPAPMTSGPPPMGHIPITQNPFSRGLSIGHRQYPSQQ